MRMAAAVALVLVLLAIATTGNYLLTVRAVQQSQQAWCPLLALIAERTPARETAAQRQAYAELAAVRGSFHCPRPRG